MSQIRSWLEDNGLGEHADSFEQNEITLELLPDLTDPDFVELGVKVLGHRLRLRREISKLAQGSDTSNAPEVESDAEATLALGPERRQLTVMFCDMVGSTALAERLDPEDLKALMQEYQAACRDVIERYEGHVAQYLGDGIMVYFGWPRAHEEDAQRAIRTALDIVQALDDLAAREPIRVKIGIATGPVVVGETGEGDAASPKTAVGGTPNLAARVQGLAGENEIIIASSTHRLAGGSFESTLR